MSEQAELYLQLAQSNLNLAGITFEQLYHPTVKSLLPPDRRLAATQANDLFATAIIFQKADAPDAYHTFPSAIAQLHMRQQPDLIIEPPQLATKVLVITFTNPLPERGFLSGSHSNPNNPAKQQSIRQLFYWYEPELHHANVITIHPFNLVNRVIFTPKHKGHISYILHKLIGEELSPEQKIVLRDKQRILNLALFCLTWLKDKGQIQ